MSERSPLSHKYPIIAGYRDRINKWGDVDTIVQFLDAVVDTGSRIDQRLPEGRNLNIVKDPGGLVAAVQYANLKTGGKRFDYFNLHTSADWTAVLESLLKSEERFQIFADNLDRPQQVTSPKRAIALNYILGKRFGGQEVYGVDAGCSANLALPLLGSDFLRSEQVEADLAVDGFQGSTQAVTLGLGIDVNPVDVDWLRASDWPLPENMVDTTLEEAITLAELRNVGQISFAQADLRDHDLIPKVVNQLLPEVNFVQTSFLLGRLYKPENQPEQQFCPLVEKLLTDGGIWINFDTTTAIPSDVTGQSNYEVRVWEKIGRKLHYLATPFLLTHSQVTISRVFTEEFKKI